METYAAAAPRLSNDFATVVSASNAQNTSRNAVIIVSLDTVSVTKARIHNGEMSITTPKNATIVDTKRSIRLSDE